jgi:hypothetical protein
MYPLKFGKLLLKHPVYVINKASRPGYEVGSRGVELRTWGIRIIEPRLVETWRSVCEEKT